MPPGCSSTPRSPRPAPHPPTPPPRCPRAPRTDGDPMTEHAHAAPHDEGLHGVGAHGAASTNWFIKYCWSTDHKVIAMQYMFTGMFLAMVGGFMAYVFRMQIAYPGMNVPLFGHVSPDAYNALITNHGSIMIFWVAMPVLIAGFGNFLIPLMVGCDDMVFPRINRLSYQIFLLSALILLASLFVPGGGFGGAGAADPPPSPPAHHHLSRGAAVRAARGPRPRRCPPRPSTT